MAVSDRSNGGIVNTTISQSLSEIATNHASAEISYLSSFAESSTNITPLANALDGIAITPSSNDEVGLNLMPKPESVVLRAFGGALLLIG